MKMIYAVLIRCAILAAVYYGFLEEVEQAANIFKFYSWIVLFAALLILSSDEFKETCAKEPAKIPVSISRIYSWSIVVAMAWFGHFFYAIAWSIIYASNVHLNEARKQKGESKNASSDAGEQAIKQTAEVAG